MMDDDSTIHDGGKQQKMKVIPIASNPLPRHEHPYFMA